MDPGTELDEKELVRIGELASWAGVTPRTVRHYHDVGLLPEPHRAANGYRQYTLSHLMQMLRIRRLVELGFRLEEIRGIVAAAEGQTLDEALVELDRHLAVQQQLIADQRAAIAALCTSDDDPAQLADVIGALASAVEADETDVELESWLLATVGGLAGMSTGQVREATAGLLTDTEQMNNLQSLMRRFAALADATVDEPEVARLAADIAASAGGPDDRGATQEGDARSGDGVLGAVSSRLAPAQARCLELMIARLPGGTR